MSRSNPTENAVHPCTRWLEWHGSKGHLQHYDKTTEENVITEFPFTFILLDELSTVKGWSDATESRIYANEVKNTLTDRLTVKTFKGDARPIAEGIYQTIKERVESCGGYFTKMLYVAYRDDEELKIGAIQLAGAALGAWMDFQRANAASIYTKAIRITGSKDGKKGSITFKTPTFELASITPETDEQAKALDAQLQEYLKGYFTRGAKTPASAPHEEEAHETPPPPIAKRPPVDPDLDPAAEDDIPF